MLLEDIDAEINILNDPISLDIVSPSTKELVKSSVDTLWSDIKVEITEITFFFTQKDLKMSATRNFRNTSSEELEEISKNIKLLENISSNFIFNKSCKIPDPL